MARTWVVALVAVAIVHLLATVAFYYWMGRSPSDALTGSDGQASTADAPDGPVRCPTCGAANEPGYRYCRECISPLGGSARDSEDEGGPGSAWMR